MVDGVVSMKVKIKSKSSNTILGTKQNHQPQGFFPKATQEGYITKFIGIIVNDAKIKIAELKYRLFLSDPTDRQKWEDYERFCKLSRGEK